MVVAQNVPMPEVFFSIQKQCFVHGKEKETGVKKKVKKISKNLTQSHFKRIGDDTLSQRYSASPFFYLAGKA